MVTSFITIVPDWKQIRGVFGILSPIVALSVLSFPLAAGAGAGGLPPPRDPGQAILEQLRSAQSAPGNDALILFLARYPEQPSAGTARRLLRARAPETIAGPGPDAEIILAFDRARLTPSALADFQRRYAGHPLAREAANPFWTQPQGALGPD